MIRLLCVGLGGMGRHDWSSADASGEFELVAGVDVDAESREFFEEKTKAPTFDDFETALATVPADAALISTPDHFHAPFSIRAMEKGLDVICEKPMAETLADANRMHDAAERLGRMLMVHQQLRWTPYFHHARQLIEQDAIGTPQSIEFDLFIFADTCFRGYRSKLPQLMLQDLAIHHFDLVRYLAGSECRGVYARSWKSNEEQKQVPATTNVYAILDLDGPVTACYRSKMRCLMRDEHTGYNCRAQITGSKGTLRIGPDQLELQTFEGFTANEEPTLITPVAPARTVWQSFADAMNTRTPTLTSSGENLNSLAVLFAAIESVETGKRVPVNGIR